MICRICHNTAGKRFYAFDRAFDRCSRCKTIQRDITAAQYAAMDITYDSGASLVTTDRAVLEAALGVPDAVDFLNRYRPTAARRMLDIGCGMGGYMRAAQLIGMDVTGYEPSLEHSSIARQIFGFDVRPEYFSGTEEKFDLIVLSHVIEHIFEPEPFLKTVVQSLSPGGRLMVVTPNAESISARATGSRWPMLVPEDHVTMLTPDAMKLLVPPGCELVVTTSEYRHEFLATVGASLRARKTTISGGISAILGKRTWRSRMLRLGLTIGSFPFFAAATLTDRRGALIAKIDRPS